MSESEFLHIYRDTVGPLYGTVVGWTHDRQLAEDIVQETFLRAVKNWPRKGVPDTPIAWLRTVARNAWISAQRAKRPEAASDTVAAAPDNEPDIPEDRLALRHGIAALENGHARILTAFHLEGRTMRDIAAHEGITERAVEGRLRRAREALRAAMTTTEPQPETNP